MKTRGGARQGSGAKRNKHNTKNKIMKYLIQFNFSSQSPRFVETQKELALSMSTAEDNRVVVHEIDARKPCFKRLRHPQVIHILKNLQRDEVVNDDFIERLIQRYE